MTQSPSKVDEKQLKELHIRIRALNIEQKND
jgi:aspartyl-tRNA synthetase